MYRRPLHRRGLRLFSPSVVPEVDVLPRVGHARRVPESAAPFMPRAPIERVLGPQLRRALGPLAAAVADPSATDVFVTGDGMVRVDRGRGAEPEPGVRLSPEAARELGVSLVATGGRHVDEATPCADVRLGEGIRAHVALPPVAWAGTAISLRLPRVDRIQLDSAGLDDGTIEVLRQALAARRTVLFSGGTGSGKTTLLAAWLSAADPADRIVIIEDVAEALIDHPHVVGLECRQPNLEGAGGIDLARLVREALRMRPDRLVVGECRGAEVREFLAALNTGHRGGAGTLHANSLGDVAGRLEAIGMMAGLPPEALARQALSGIDLVVHLERDRDGGRSARCGTFGLDARERLVVRELRPPRARARSAE